LGLLNGNIIGGKRGGFYHDDLWNLKYLKGFKWSNLMEQVQMEQQMQEGQMRTELLQEERERKSYIENLHRSKVEKGMEAKRLKKAQTEALRSGSESKQPEDLSVSEAHRKAIFDRKIEYHEENQPKAVHRSFNDHANTLQDFLL